MRELSQTEVHSVLEKIRSEYKEQAKLNPKFFDLAGFESRYSQILQLRGNVGKFLTEEIQFLEQLKGKIKELAAKKEAAKAETLNRLMDESMEKLLKYRKIDFHPLAKSEIRYFYGAIVDYAEMELPVLLHIFRGTPEYSQLQDPLLQIERLGQTRRGLPSLKIQEFIKTLLDANGNPVIIEKVSQNLLKEGCIALKNILLSIEDLTNRQRINPDLLVQVNEKDYPNAHNAYGMKKFGEVLALISERNRQIIQDFRMNALMNLAG